VRFFFSFPISRFSLRADQSSVRGDPQRSKTRPYQTKIRRGVVDAKLRIISGFTAGVRADEIYRIYRDGMGVADRIRSFLGRLAKVANQKVRPLQSANDLWLQV
jgi:hypothetical protein